MDGKQEQSPWSQPPLGARSWAPVHQKVDRGIPGVDKSEGGIPRNLNNTPLQYQAAEGMSREWIEHNKTNKAEPEATDRQQQCVLLALSVLLAPCIEFECAGSGPSRNFGS